MRRITKKLMGLRVNYYLPCNAPAIDAAEIINSSSRWTKIETSGFSRAELAEIRLHLALK